MANAMKGEAEVRLADGRNLRLVFDANAWIEAEDVLGKGVQAILAELQPDADGTNRCSLKTQRAVIFGGLRRHHPEMTLIEAGEILIEAAEAMARGIGGAMPRDDDGEGEAGEADAHPTLTAKAGPRRGTGTRRKPPGRG